MDRTKRRRGGHTLVELMIAILLLAACAMIFAATIPTAHESRGKADNSNVATSLASKMIEEIRAAGYANTTPAQLVVYGLIDSATPVSTDTYSFTNIDSALVDAPANTLTSGVGRLNIVQTNIDLKTVTATVTWNEMGQTKTIAVSTLLANL